MGLLYKVEYRDSNDNVLCNGYIGIAVASNPVSTATIITNDYNWFTDHLADESESIYLGCPYFAYPAMYDNANNIPYLNKWFPLCSYKGTSEDAFNYIYSYNIVPSYKIVFIDSGHYITYTYTYSECTVKGFSSNGTQIFSYTVGARKPLIGGYVIDYSSSNGQRMNINTLTVQSIESNGTISRNTRCYITTVDYWTNGSGNMVRGSFTDWGKMSDCADFFNAIPHYSSTDYDPYESDPNGPTTTGGGTGTFSRPTEPIDFPTDPTISAVDTNFITLYNPTLSQLRNFATYLWGTSFDLAQFKKLFTDPMSAVLGMSILPVAIPNGGNQNVVIGNIDTGISMNKAGSQIVTVDCGSVLLEEYWGSYLDYDPYTKIELYLPFIGTHAISADDVMNKTIHVKYKVDILSGACCAIVKCGDSVLYTFVGQCACSVPITGNDWTNVVNGALTIAASIGSMVATGGASAPVAATSIASTAVNSMKPHIEKSGSMGGMGGMLGILKPYLIITTPRQAVPEQQNKFIGYPSFITTTLGSCSGYTEVESVHLENISGVEEEIKEIETLLINGVIL